MSGLDIEVVRIPKEWTCEQVCERLQGYDNKAIGAGPKYWGRTDSELRALVLCMRRHDDEHTQRMAMSSRAVFVWEINENRPGSDVTCMEPAPQCVAKQVQRLEFYGGKIQPHMISQVDVP